MSHVLRALGLCLLAAACQGPALDPATGLWRPKPGDLLFHAAGSYADRELGDEDLRAISLQAGLSLVATERNEFGGDLIVTDFDGSGGDARTALLAGRYSYLLNATEYGRPYAGVHVGLLDVNSPTEDGLDPAFGVHAGLRWWLAPGIGFFVEPRLTASHAVRETGLYFGLILNLTPR